MQPIDPDLLNALQKKLDVGRSRAYELIQQKVAEANPWKQEGSEVLVRVRSFADSGITMQLRTWIRDVLHRADARSWTNLEIWRSFRDQGVEIPFPQRVVHQPAVQDIEDALDE